MMQRINSSIDSEMLNCVTELLSKMDLGCTKVEQCAFDAINTTDQVMMKLQNVMELLQIILKMQAELDDGIKMISKLLDNSERECIQGITAYQTKCIQELEAKLHDIINAAVESNDAARCIEAGVAEQSEYVNELLDVHNKLGISTNDL